MLIFWQRSKWQRFSAVPIGCLFTPQLPLLCGNFFISYSPVLLIIDLDSRMTVLFRKSSPPSALCSISHAFSSNSRFDSEVLDPLEVTFVPAEKQGPSFIMLRLQILFSRCDLSLMLSSPQGALRSF